MKSFAFLIFAFAIFGSLTAAPHAEEDLADKVQKVVDEMLSDIPESIDWKDHVIDISNNIEKGTITIGELSLTGIKDLATKFTYDDDSSRLNFTFDWGNIDFVFDITIQVEGFITMNNHLVVKVDIKDVKKEGYAVVSEDSKEVTDLDLVENVAEINFDIQGLLNDDEISQKVSKFLTENVATVLNVIQPALAPYLNTIVKDIINIALKISS